jgi:hypothetical protein
VKKFGWMSGEICAPIIWISACTFVAIGGIKFFSSEKGKEDHLVAVACGIWTTRHTYFVIIFEIKLFCTVYRGEINGFSLYLKESGYKKLLE